MSAKHHYDLQICRKQAGRVVGKLCNRCEGKCPICDNFVHPQEKARICEECAFGASGTKCIICGGKGESEAYYCDECVILGKDRDGCPKILTLNISKADNYYHQKGQQHKFISR